MQMLLVSSKSTSPFFLNFVHDSSGVRDSSRRNSQSLEYLPPRRNIPIHTEIPLVIEFQRYPIADSSKATEGINAYAVLSSPRATGTEAMVISASWISRMDDGHDALNLRGVSTVLALAAFLKSGLIFIYLSTQG